MESERGLQAIPTPNDLIHVIGKQAVRIAELEAENTALCAKSDVHPARSAGSEGRSSESLAKDNSRLMLAPSRVEESLVQNYAELLVRYEKLKADLAQRESKYREAKDVIKQWKAYVDRKLLSADGRSSAQAHGNTKEILEHNPEELVLPADAAIQTLNPNGRDGRSEEAAGQLHQGELDLPTPRPLRRHNGKFPQVTSSQTTEDIEDFEDPSRMAIKQEPFSDDLPVVVSARSLKRKASTSAEAVPLRRIKQEPASPSMHTDLTSRKSDSPRPQPRALYRDETSDLDAIGTNLDTPHRSTSTAPARHRAASQDTARRRPSPLPKGSSSDDQAHSHDQNPKMAVDGIREIDRDASMAKSLPASNTKRARATASPHGRVLQQLSVNVQSLSPARAATNRKRRNGIAAVQTLAEDGDDANSQAEAINTRADNSSSRLHALLSNASPTRTPLAAAGQAAAAKSRMRPSAAVAHAPKKEADVAPAPKKKEADEEAAPTERASTPSRRAVAPAASREQPPLSRAGQRGGGGGGGSSSSSSSKLRAKPLSSLRAEDFRINPRYMGTDFAFADPLRGRELRRALPPCTRPACCGDAFRRVVELGGAAVSGRSDDAVLEEYLGPDWRAIMDAREEDSSGSVSGSVSDSAKKMQTKQTQTQTQTQQQQQQRRHDVLVQAHVHSFARQHGRHRHAFQRRTTPPGFWRTDMPTTQQTAQDREQARQGERRQVEERWREAMSAGGRWLFRDES